MRKINLIVVHCSATRADQDIGKVEIDVWHKARGFAKIGYHYVIRRDSTLEKGRDEEEVGAHAKDYNANSLGVCLVGGINARGRPENNFTAQQFDELRMLLVDLTRRYPEAKVLGHRDLPWVAKACPCFDVRDWLHGLADTARSPA